MGKIRKGRKEHQGRITDKTISKDQGLTFSFKHINLHGDPDFSLEHTEDGYTQTLLERLRDMSGLSVGEFMNGRALRTHPINWQETTRRDGFAHLNEQLQGLTPWQFQLTANEHGRVYGFLIEDTFFVVWLDPAHKLYGRP